MAEVKFGLLENLPIKNWYRFLLYVGGVILILSMFLEPKGITISQVRTFSIHTIILSLIVWIVYDIFYAFVNKMSDFEYENNVNGLIIIKYTIAFVGLFIWITSIVSIIP